MSLSLRAGALLAAGSLMVHELRYVVGYGNEGPAATSGHGYLAWLAPLVALALAIGCGVWLSRIGRRDGSGQTLSWLDSIGSLAAVYVVQETIEALTTPGHPGLLTHDGWVAAPVVIGVAALVTLLLRGLRAADQVASTAARPSSPLRSRPVAPLAITLPSTAPLAPRHRGLARRIAGRAPPLAS
jgi:hypothetical protein